MTFARVLQESKKKPNQLIEYTPVRTSRFEKDLQNYKSSSHNWNDDFNAFKEVLKYLKYGRLPPVEKNRPHKIIPSSKALKKYSPVWDIHIGSPSSDWVLLVHINKGEKRVYFLATGTHSYLSKRM